MRLFAITIVLCVAACGSSDGSSDADAGGPETDGGGDTDAGDATVCVATSPETLVACADGDLPTIEVRGSIVCSGPDACRAKIDGRAITIRGAAGASIRRVDNHDYAILQVIGSSSAAITDLVLDEDADVDCEPVSPTNPPVENPDCGRTIDLYGVADAVIDNVTVAASKSMAVSVNTGGSLRISHSRFVAPLQFGAQVTGLTGAVTIEDTIFWHAASNGLVLYDLHGTAEAPLTTRRNLFDHNHLDDVYFVCGPDADARCSGGQLLVAGKVDFLRVEDTAIRLGSQDADPETPVGGVELNFPEVRDITFADDDVHTHGMWGIYLNSDPVDVERITITDSKLYDNGKDPDYLGVDVGSFPDGVVTETGTCTTADCKHVTVGGVWALPGGAVTWISNDADAPEVMVDGESVSTEANGETTADPGAVVVLSDGATELDRVTVPWTP